MTPRTTQITFAALTLQRHNTKLKGCNFDRRELILRQYVNKSNGNLLTHAVLYCSPFHAFLVQRWYSVTTGPEDVSEQLGDGLINGSVLTKLGTIVRRAAEINSCLNVRTMN